MTLFINNEAVAKVLTMPDTIEALERAYRETVIREAACRPRVDIQIPTSDPRKIETAISNTTLGGGTALYDAVLEGEQLHAAVDTHAHRYPRRSDIRSPARR